MSSDPDWADSVFEVQGNSRRRWRWLALVAVVITAGLVLLFVPQSTPEARPPAPVATPRVTPPAADQALEPLPNLGVPRKQSPKRALLATTPHVDPLEDRQ